MEHALQVDASPPGHHTRLLARQPDGSHPDGRCVRPRRRGGAGVPGGQDRGEPPYPPLARRLGASPHDASSCPRAQELPNWPGAVFDSAAVLDNAHALLSFLHAHCTRPGGSYWVARSRRAASPRRLGPTSCTCGAPLGCRSSRRLALTSCASSTCARSATRTRPPPTPRTTRSATRSPSCAGGWRSGPPPAAGCPRRSGARCCCSAPSSSG